MFIGKIFSSYDANNRILCFPATSFFVDKSIIQVLNRGDNIETQFYIS